MLPPYVMVILYSEQSAIRYIQVKLDINRHCWQKCVCSILMSYLQQSCSNIHFSYIITGWSKCKMLAGVADQKRRIANSSHIIVSECALRWGLEKGLQSMAVFSLPPGTALSSEGHFSCQSESGSAGIIPKIYLFVQHLCPWPLITWDVKVKTRCCALDKTRKNGRPKTYFCEHFTTWAARFALSIISRERCLARCNSHFLVCVRDNFLTLLNAKAHFEAFFLFWLWT